MAGSIIYYEVVGGAAKGGLLVREGKDRDSEEVQGRLATGALVVALEVDAEAERMLYEKVTGSGPEKGWISTHFRGKELLVVVEDEISTDEASTEDVLSEEISSEDLAEVEAEERADLALQLYCARFGEAEVAEDEETAAEAEEEGEAPMPEVCAELERDLSTEAPSSEAAGSSSDSDADLVLCSHCRLPVGQVAYDSECGLVHGECLAQQVLREMQAAEQEREQEKASAKRARREEFEIGWRAQEHIPSNEGPAARLSCPVPEGMCCLVFQEETNSVGLAATVEPAAAVNLEYLSTALEVRRRENREPLFSLDPVDASSEFYDPKQSMQVKRFEPAWLAGTSVGEVLFQSDYHLKELSMGEYEQPVVGMKSCHEFSNLDAPEWSAREWYVVRKAEVQMSGDNVLMPHVKMGVEAREQIIGPNGLEDVKTTKPNHPLVKYAEMFTHNFDLIAERKSVVYHLRELAKASVLAKFLMESDISLDDSWFSMADEPKEACCLEIPQLWNDRCHSQIRVQDGKIVNAETAFGANSHSLYGGVQFGLDKFQLSGARQPARMMSAGLAARQFVQPARHLSATLSAGLATRQFQRSFGPMGVQPARVSAGVGLDKFALSGARQPARMMSAGLAARQFVQPARHLSATLSAGLAARQFQRSFGPMGVQPARVSAGVGLDKFALSGARQPARMMSAGLAARQFVQPARHLSATLSAGLATRQFQRSFGPMGVQPARVSAGVGLDKFALSGARQPARMMSAGLAARQFVQPARHLSATLSAGLATRQFQRSFGPMGVQPARVAGVDLNLDEFNLSAPTEVERQDICVQLDSGANISAAFWSGLDGEFPAAFSEEDKNLLRHVFNPLLSDRREEGELFVPPDTSFAYVQKLRALVKEEEAVQQQRKDHFFSKSFSASEPGPLFPASWASTVEIAREDANGKQGCSLHARPDYKAQAQVFEQALKSAVPAFDKHAEDGARFRVYRIGSLEVRTAQEHGGEEVIGAVFSTQAEGAKQQGVSGQERVVKVTEFVERAGRAHSCYLALETEGKNVLIMEGKKVLENPKDLEDRNSLAKVVRTANASHAKITIQDVKSCQADVYALVSGTAAETGFRSK